MSILRISTKVVTDIVGTLGLRSTSIGYLSASGRVRIMQGTIPTQTQINNADATFRDGDMLIEVASNSITIATIPGNISWNQRIVAATNSGTASWFMWRASTSSTPTPIMVGDISNPGGAGDMTLTDLNIIAGNDYAIGPADFTIPREYNY